MEAVVAASAEDPQAPPNEVDVPISGTVGTGRVERLFCALAHEFLRGETAEVEYCSQRRGQMCGLTGYEQVCLFEVPQDPQWNRIRELIDRRAGMDV
jgi:hypothetical protein